MPLPFFFFLLAVLAHGVCGFLSVRGPFQPPRPVVSVSPVDSDPNQQLAWQQWLRGGKANLNRVSEADMRLVPGVGRALAKALVQRRIQLGGFAGWAEVDAVRGVGPQTLIRFQQLFVLPP